MMDVVRSRPFSRHELRVDLTNYIKYVECRLMSVENADSRAKHSGVQRRAPLPLFEELKREDSSKFSDADLLMALTAMKVISPTRKKVCRLDHEIFDRPNTCPDEGLLTCPHTHAFELIYEAIHRCQKRGLIDNEEAETQEKSLLTLTSKLDSMDAGGTYIQQEIDSGGRSGQEVLPAYLEILGLTHEEILDKPVHEAKKFVSEKIGPQQVEIGQDIDGIRSWIIDKFSGGLIC